jgi:hypothetical protein
MLSSWKWPGLEDRRRATYQRSALEAGFLEVFTLTASLYGSSIRLQRVVDEVVTRVDNVVPVVALA